LKAQVEITVAPSLAGTRITGVAAGYALAIAGATTNAAVVAEHENRFLVVQVEGQCRVAVGSLGGALGGDQVEGIGQVRGIGRSGFRDIRRGGADDDDDETNESEEGKG